MRHTIHYPYTIKPVFKLLADPHANSIPQPQLLALLRIECMLRSATVRRLYRNKPKYTVPMDKSRWDVEANQWVIPRAKRTRLSGDELEKEYKIDFGWHVLRGAHHALLKGPVNDESDAVVDLKALAKRKPAKVQFEEYLLLDDPSALSLRFNITMPLYVLQAELKRRYEKQKAVLPKNKKTLGPVEPKTWSNYLRWHDLHTINGRSAQRILDTEPASVPPITKSAIEQGLRKVPRMIRYAENRKNTWPPPNNFLH